MPKDYELISFLGDQLSSYEEIWAFQKSRVDEVVAERAKEALIFCEHQEVITAGRRFQPENILSKQTPTLEIERGGDVTWHGPGQLVIYPIFFIRKFGGLHLFLRFWEEVSIRMLKDLGLNAGRFGPTGVWIKTKNSEIKKILSMGIAVRRWVSFHGLALNISNDLSAFQKIRPCDFDAQVMTSLAAEGVNISLLEAQTLFVKHFEALEASGFVPADDSSFS